MSARIATGVTVLEAARLVAEVPRWRESFEVVPGVHAPGEADPLPLLRRLDLAPRMDGLHVLDAGCRDGFFAFEMERRGARVCASHQGGPGDGFLLARDLRHSRVAAVGGDVYELGEEAGGPFDLVLCPGAARGAPPSAAGARRPGGAGAARRDAVGGDRGHRPGAAGDPGGQRRAVGDAAQPLMRFTPAPRPGGGWAPTVACLESMVASARFLVRGAGIWSPGRALVRAVRDARPRAGGRRPGRPAPGRRADGPGR